MIFDLHCDTVWKIHALRKEGGTASLIGADSLQLDEEKMRRGNYFAQCFALWVHAQNDDPYALYRELLTLYREELEKCVYLREARSFADLLQNRSEGKISAVLTMEDAAPLGNSIERLREFYLDGVRMISLTWNYPNALGYPHVFSEAHCALTVLGREFVREANRLGVLIDVSHLSDAGFFEVLALSEKPIVASHSNARALCAHSRNLSDEMLLALAENGGVMGINYAAAFLDAKDGQKTIERALAHIRYIKKRIGVEHIALGSDFDGIDPAIELQNAGMLPCLADALAKDGFSDDEIEKITHKNALRVFKENLL